MNAGEWHLISSPVTRSTLSILQGAFGKAQNQSWLEFYHATVSQDSLEARVIFYARVQQYWEVRHATCN